MKEEIIQFGEGGRLFGMLTLPEGKQPVARELPVFLFLSAGMLHRVGPSRLHVRLAKRLAAKGFTSLRIDLSGKGDSAARAGLSNQESVAADFAEILEVVGRRLGDAPLILAGLCSGADNAIRLTIGSQRVIGMVLLDPLCFQDKGFRVRSFVQKYFNPARYVLWMEGRLARLGQGRPKQEARADSLTLRDLPTRAQMRDAFTAIGQRKGRVLSVFTDYAQRYYNRKGQLGKVLGVKDYDSFSTELFWPESEHTYRLESHRRRLIDEVERWAIDGFLRGGRDALQAPR